MEKYFTKKKWYIFEFGIFKLTICCFVHLIVTDVTLYLQSADLCLGVEEKMIKEIMYFSLYNLYGHALAQ